MTRARPRGAVATTTSQEKRCAIYTRKSTAIGADVSLSSLDAQRDVCGSYIDAKKGECWRALADHYDDGGYTGANLERPAFRRLMADIAAGKVDIVVVYKVDRLSRSLLDFAEVIRFFEKHHVAFVSVTQSFSTADAMGRLVLNMLMSFAEFEREMIAERTRDKIAVARRRGKWTGGIVPFGYRLVKSKLVPDADLAPLVRRAFDLYLERRSVLDVVRFLDEVAPRTSRVGLPRPWARNDVQRLVANPIYAGLVRVPGGGLVDGEHTGIIDRETFNRAAGLGRKSPASPRADDEYLLRGLVRCGACGVALTPSTTAKPKQSTATRYRYYRCMTRNRRGARVCPVPPVAAGALEAAVVSALKDMVATPMMGEEVASEASHQLTERLVDLVRERGQLDQRLASHTRAAETQAAALGALPREARETSEAAMTEELAAAAAVERRLIELDAEVRRVQAAANDLTWVREVLRDFDGIWAVLTSAEQARCVGLMIERVVISSESQVQVEWRSFEAA